MAASHATGWTERKYQLAAELTPRLYEAGLLETLYNAREPHFREHGWRFKSGVWSPSFLNLRHAGDDPELMQDIGTAMALMHVNEMPECNKIVGIAMAGIPIAKEVSSQALARLGRRIPFLYTRDLPKNVRTPEDAQTYLNQLRQEFAPTIEYGQHQLVEGTIESGDRIVVTDDMATNIGSKFIARHIMGFEIDRRNYFRQRNGMEPIEGVGYNHISILLNREQGSDQEAWEAGLKLHALIPFKSVGLKWLQGKMSSDDEWELIADYQQNPKKYQDPAVIAEVLRTKKKVA